MKTNLNSDLFEILKFREYLLDLYSKNINVETKRLGPKLKFGFICEQKFK